MTVFKNLGQSRNRIKKTNPKRTEETVENVKNFAQENSTTSLQKSSPQVSCTKTPLWRILRKDLGQKLCHYTSVQPLTDAQKSQRKNFRQWILEQSPDIIEKIEWTEEKFFCLYKKPHQKNDEV